MLNVMLKGICSGGTLVISIAVAAAEYKIPVYGLILVVPVPDTNPSYAEDTWGEIMDSLSLTPLRLLGELNRFSKCIQVTVIHGITIHFACQSNYSKVTEDCYGPCYFRSFIQVTN